MKLLSCYIEGYGKIKRREYTFAEGIASFCEDNGEGKTTLASFIKAMLYGLKGYNKRSMEFCDREHFYPFDGGLFGGNLTLQSGGKTYKIERFFGEKSEKDDKCKVYCNGEETTELGEEVGRAILGLDRESFERTAFLESGDIEISSTSNIHAQLNKFLEGGEAQGGLDEALERLDKAAKTYKKSRAGNDKVTALSAQIDTLRHEVENATAIKRALEGKYAEAKRLQGEITALSARMVVAQEEKEKRSQFEHYDSLVNGVERAKMQLQAIEREYPLGLPSQMEIEAVNEYMVRANELKIKAESGRFSPEENEKLSRLEGRFSQGAPTEETLCAVEEDIQRFGRLTAQSALPQTQTQEKESKGKGRVFLFAVAALFALAGLVLCLFKEYWGLALVVVGGAGLVYGLLAARKGEAAREELLAQRQAEEKRAQDIEELGERLAEFFIGYGLRGENYIKLLGELRLLCAEYANLRGRKLSAQQVEDGLREELRVLLAKIAQFQDKYQLKEVKIHALIENLRESARLRSAIAEGNAQAAIYKQNKGLDEYSSRSFGDLTELQAVFSATQSEKSKLDREIAEDERLAEKLEEYEIDLANAEERLKEYKRKHSLLTATAVFLQRADGKLRDKYVKPVREEFLRYASVIERALGEKVVMTKDFELRFERNGMERSERHFSAGQRSVCALCFRLALVKNMYQGEQPFLILDDPFTGLDEKHMLRVREVLNELSKDMQMLYFTCHESRRV